MATLVELKTLLTDPVLGDKVQMACIIVAEEIRAEDSGTTNHANRLKWAKAVWRDSGSVRDDMLSALLGQKNDLTLAQITTASDAAIIQAVGDAVNVFADGE